MTNVTIHGELGAIYGRSHKFKVSKLLEITKALNANMRGFKNFLLTKSSEGLDYVFIDPSNPTKKWNSAEDLLEEVAPKEVHIVPVVGGSAVFSAIMAVAGAIGGALAAAGAALMSGGFLANLAVGLLIQGVMSLLFPVELPKAPQEAKSRIDHSSYIFTNLENNVVQGFPIPLLYGELRVGSNVISTNVISEDLG